jgi:hypothetical protein
MNYIPWLEHEAGELLNRIWSESEPEGIPFWLTVKRIRTINVQ